LHWRFLRYRDGYGPAVSGGLFAGYVSFCCKNVKAAASRSCSLVLSAGA